MARKTEDRIIVALRAENEELERKLRESQTSLKKFATTADTANKQVAQSMTYSDVATRKVAKSMDNLNYRITNASRQFQDVVVQAQAGTDAFTIMAQQGSQLAEVLGRNGPLIGGVIAIAAAVGGALWKALDSAAVKADEAREAFENLIGSTARAQIEAMNAQIEQGKDRIRELRSEVSLATNAFHSLRFSSIYVYGSEEDFAKAQASAAEERLQAVNELTRAEEALRDLIKNRDELEGKRSGTSGESIEEQRKYYAELWDLERQGQEFINDLAVSALGHDTLAVEPDTSDVLGRR
jgi:hypothetical protein